MLEFAFVAAKMPTVMLTLTVTFVVKLSAHTVNAFVFAFTWPRLTFVISITVYVLQAAAATRIAVAPILAPRSNRVNVCVPRWSDMRPITLPTTRSTPTNSCRQVL